MKKLSTLSLYLLVLLAIATQSCRKDPEPTPQPCALSTIRTGSDTLEVFAYNAAGQLVKYIQGNFIHQLQYDGAGQLVRVVYSYTDMQSVREQEMTLTHSNNGKTVVIRMPVSFFPTPYEYTAELDDNGQLVRYTIHEGSNRLVRRYEYNGEGNLIRQFQMDVMPADTTEYLVFAHENFDGKPNPYFTSRSLRMYRQLIQGDPVGRHNALLTREYGRDGEVIWTNTRTNNAYDNQGQLISQSGRVEAQSGFSFVYDFAYTYRCP